jgi:hypothetical protein
MARKSKNELLDSLRRMVRAALRLRSDGSGYAQMARTNGTIDGYMRVLLESGIAEPKELLAIVAEERSAAYGPSLQHVEGDALSVLAA